MNRAERRRIARERGLKPDKIKAVKRAERVAQKLEAKVLSMGSAEARRILAEWAARPDHDKRDIDLLNEVASHGREGTAG